MGKVEKASIAVAVIAIIIAAIAIYYASSVTSEASGLRGLVTDLSRKVDSLSGQVSTLSSKVSELEKALGAMAPPKPPLEELLKGCTLRVGVCLPLSGAMAAFGESGLRGIQLATEEINSAGGILGAKIELIIEDFAGDPKVAVTATEKLITVNKVHVVRGYFTSSGAMSAVPVAEKYKTPVLSVGSSAKELCMQGWKYWFKTPPNSTMFSLVAVDFLTKWVEPQLKLGRPLRIAIIHENTLMGVSDKNEFLNVTKSKGLKWEIVAVEAYQSGALDFKPLLEKVKAAAPDVIAMSGYLTDTVLIAKQANEIGLKAIWISIGGAGMQTPKLIELAGENVKYWFVCNEYWYDRAYPNKQAGYEVSKKFMARYGYPHDFQSWAGYAGMYMLKLVIEDLAKQNPDALKAAFEKDDVATIREMIASGLRNFRLYIDWLGEIYFEPNGQMAYSISGPTMGCTVLQVQPASPGDLWYDSKSGLTFHTVWSPVYKTADPILPPR